MKDYGKESHSLSFERLREALATTPLSVTIASVLAEDLELAPGSSRTSEELIIRVDRPAPAPVVELPPELEKVILGPLDNAHRRPEIAATDGTGNDLNLELRSEAESWLQHWDKWASATRAEEMYKTLFEMQVKARQQADEFELVLGAGWLSWDLGPDKTIDRPIFFLGLEIEMDKATGAIEIRESADPLVVELEALPADQIGDGRFIEDLKTRVASFEGSIIAASEFGDLAEYAVNGLNTQARYEASPGRVGSDGRAVLSWAPTIVLRPRQRAGLSATFRSIAQEIEQVQAIPTGLRPLVDPGFEAEVSLSQEPGAIFEVNGELYSPLPLNEKQRRVVEHVDSHAHTIVQGPPGTGKTHMAAALLSHLLAQGKRVLVTAQTERALYELRGKLPPEIRELAVSVIGSSSQELTDLRTAIETIQRKSSAFDEVRSSNKIASLERELDDLRQRRVAILRRWAAALEAEQRPVGLPGYAAPLSEVVMTVAEKQEKYGWIEELGVPSPGNVFPLAPNQIDELIRLLGNTAVVHRSSYPEQEAIDPARFISPTQFAQVLGEIEDSTAKADAARASVDGAFLSTWLSLDESDRELVKKTVSTALNAKQRLESFPSQWTATVNPDTPTHELDDWDNTKQEVSQRLGKLADDLGRLAGTQRIFVDGEFDAFVPMAQSLLQYLASGKTLNVRPDGSVKPPMFGGSTVKATLPFLNAVRINGVPPSTIELVNTYLAYVSVIWELQALQHQWPLTTLNMGDPVGTVSAIKGDLEKFDQNLRLLRDIAQARETISRLGLPTDFSGMESLHNQFPLLQDATDAGLAVASAEANFERVSGKDHLASYNGPMHAWVRSFMSAVQARDVAMYEEALRAGSEFHGVGLQRRHLDELLGAIRSWSPVLAAHLEEGVVEDEWVRRLGSIEDARKWLVAKNYVQMAARNQREDIQSELERTDRRLHDALSSLAAERAWAAAVGSSRIDGAMRATMEAYAQAVRRLGKGTGKYAGQHRRDVRRHLDSARGAVPVWIMPIYKVVEQFDLQQNMFDVVIVDEASQAGVESVFLQYLAPKVVVVGDDHQVSPAGVGEDIGRLQQLARQYLYDFDKIDAWVDPKRSLFDDANMRYGGRIALEEHRRCVPEIIEFSNELVYRPNNIELQPVREVSGNRLAPFRVTHTPNAFEKGKSKKINQLEADALIDRLIGVLDAPDYDGKTIGVISLLSSSGQAEYIQNRLVTMLPPHIWEERDLKVGVPAAFQGAERDVIFLSMVTPSPGEFRLSALTREDHKQRYNVAVSRAKDQVWLFHSVGVEDFANKDDLRFKLLEYAYRVAEAAPEQRTAQLVPGDRLVEPFDSLFEQRVFNELVRRGYYVIPQFDAFGRRIDLVVQGSEGRLAVECDGDHWHGDEHAVADQARQRELERLGWVFVRIFESDFYLDKESEIQRIIDRLDELGIQPGFVDGQDANERRNVEIVDSATELFGGIEGEVGPENAPEFARSGLTAQIEVEETIEKPAEGKPEIPASTPAVVTTSTGPAEPYEEFRGSTVSVYSAGRDQIDQGLMQIIQVEGPIPREQLFQRYVKSGGDARVRDQARDVLRAGVMRLVRRGEIVECGLEPVIYRTPEQPDVRPRLRGPRSAADIPHNEWVAHMRAVMETGSELDGEEMLRATMQRVGYRKLTDNIRGVLTAVRRDIG